jgi:polar amino acid transport system permease protein
MLRGFGGGDLWYLVEAARWTVALTALAMAGGGLLGLIVMTLRVVPFGPANGFATGYIQVLQGTPLLGQLFVFYFGFSILGLDVSAWVAAGAALSIYASSFLAEIWRGCIQAIPKTQWVASAALGLSFFEQLRHVIIPQALRIAIPPTVGFLVHLVKNTSLASVIGFIELTRAGQIITGATFQPFLVYSCVAMIYFAICFPLSLYARRLERSLHGAR